MSEPTKEELQQQAEELARLKKEEWDRSDKARAEKADLTRARREAIRMGKVVDKDYAPSLNRHQRRLHARNSRKRVEQRVREAKAADRRNAALNDELFAAPLVKTDLV